MKKMLNFQNLILWFFAHFKKQLQYMQTEKFSDMRLSEDRKNTHSIFWEVYFFRMELCKIIPSNEIEKIKYNYCKIFKLNY